MNPGWRKNYLRYKAYFLNVATLYRERTDLKVYLEILLSLATVSAFAVFALKPTLLTIAELIKEIEVKKEVLNTMNEKIRDLRGAQTLYDQNINKIKYIKSAVPQTSSPEIFVRQIEGLAAKNQVQIYELTIDKTVISGPEKTTAKTSSEEKAVEKEPLPEDSRDISVTVSTVTSFDQFLPQYNFLTDLERLRWPIKTDELIFSIILNREQQAVLVMTVKGRLPYFNFEVNKQ